MSIKGNKNIQENKTNNDKEEKLLVKSAHEASSKAVRSSKALGLTIKFIENKSIVEVSPKGRKVLRKTNSAEVDLSKLKKGMTLNRK